jgi:hypothetical protein
MRRLDFEAQSRRPLGLLSRVIAAFVAAAWLAGGPAWSCAFHTYKPERTAVDWLIEARHLVLARPGPNNEFAYGVVQVIRNATATDQLPFLVSSPLRRRLAANPKDAVLFAAGDDVQWRQVAYVDPDFRRIMQAVIKNAERWRAGYHPARLEMFAALQDHPNPSLRDLSIRELDKAPYSLLRRIDVRIPPETLLAKLWTREGYPYQSITVLLLGLTQSPEARTEIHAFIDRVADWDEARNLGAFATALVELDQADGVARLEGTILADRSQPLQKVEQVIEALTIHNGVGSLKLRKAIAAALGRLVQARPETAALVARQFAARSDWSQASWLKTRVQPDNIPGLADRLAVESYLAWAKAVGVSLSTAERGH